MWSAFSNGSWSCCSRFARDQLTLHLKTCSLVTLFTRSGVDAMVVVNLGIRIAIESDNYVSGRRSILSGHFCSYLE
jgi:hypothetical protein